MATDNSLYRISATSKVAGTLRMGPVWILAGQSRVISADLYLSSPVQRARTFGYITSILIYSENTANFVEGDGISIEDDTISVADNGVTDDKINTGISYAKITPTIQIQSQKGQAGGYASLDVGGQIPTGQIPVEVLTIDGGDIV